MNLVLAGTFFENYGLLIILVLFLGVMFFLNYRRNKSAQQKAGELANQIVPGAKVKTYSGFYGTVVKVTETTDGKVVTLQIGDAEHPSYVDMDMNAVYGIDIKELMSEYNARIEREEKEEAERLAKEQAELEKEQQKALKEKEEVERLAKEQIEEKVEDKTEKAPKKKTTKKEAK